MKHSSTTRIAIGLQDGDTIIIRYEGYLRTHMLGLGADLRDVPGVVDVDFRPDSQSYVVSCRPMDDDDKVYALRVLLRVKCQSFLFRMTGIQPNQKNPDSSRADLSAAAIPAFA